MNVRPWFSALALGLSLAAAVVSYLDSDTVELAFFGLTAVLAATQALLTRQPDVDLMRRTAQGIAIGWVVAAIGIGVLLLMYESASRPPPAPEETYLGLTATVYHVVAVYGGALAVLIAGFGPKRWLER